MGKEIKKRDGFFKSMHKYSSNESYEQRKKDLEDNPVNLEKNDRRALLISAFLTIMLPCVLVLAVMILLAMLAFRLF